MPQKNKNLANAKISKKDEFYTQLSDIENELKHYKEHFKWKIIFCNCDDPYESNFFKYFASNFNILWLKKLIATWYSTSPIAFTQLPLFEVAGYEWQPNKAYKIEINEVYDANEDGAINLADVEYLLKTWKWKNKLTLLKWDGDFRSKESINLLKQSDIVVTNPPFSLFPEYLAQLVEYKKNFIIWWNNNAITYKWVFPLIKANKLWLWYSVNKTYIFRMPNYYDKYDEKITIEKNDWFRYWKVPAISIYTNLDIKKRHEDLVMYKKYNSKEFPKYDNYEAIEVGKVAEIPFDYEWIMWVPITFLDKYNPEQFELLGATESEWKGFSNWIRDENSWVSQPVVGWERVYKRLFIRRRK